MGCGLFPNCNDLLLTNDFLCFQCFKTAAVSMWFYLISCLIVKYERFVPNSDTRAVRMINGDLDNVCGSGSLDVKAA